MTKYKIKITGSGTIKEITESLLSIITEITCYDIQDTYEDPTLCCEITEDNDKEDE